MRIPIILSFITLDGVMQAPGSPEEDPTGGFKYGGWVASYFDDFLGKIMFKQMSKSFDLLLGRKRRRNSKASVNNTFHRMKSGITRGGENNVRKATALEGVYGQGS